MTTSRSDLRDRQWLTLGLARALLGINEATLRQWADAGLVRVFRTPGGHRRFATEDIYALIEDGSHGAEPSVQVGGGAAVLPRIRRRVRSSRPNAPAWMAKFDGPSHERMRVLGREFLDRCIEFMDGSDRETTLAAATALGEAYGRESLERGLSSGEALGAFLFFRNATVEAIKPSLLSRGASAEDVCSALEQLTRLTDEVLVSLMASYQAPARKRKPASRA
ncbi:MAG: helix-turn-helix domain-containing protein [Chloroflexi bacterium]|nr:helix-turn-helix domain-containing protein [Chloroflexota bacterium]MCI0778774.1 helix-turn-helix domain-containing protein [Chloroflexota bacterium]MCI0816397.1 helix-turn-helix domain-containing protein [Chloroflexota bacterium]